MRKKSMLTFIACILLFTVVVFVGCGSKDESEKSANENLNNAVTESDASVQEESLGIDAEEAEKTTDFSIETAYCTLYYPAKWQKQACIEIVEEDAYTVQFYGQVEGKEKKHLFDVFFNCEEGTKIGDLKLADGAIVSVNIDSYELEFGEGWTEDEMNVLWSMQEAVNHVISKLEANESFDSIF